mgnify:CR=1 FL=1
MSNKTNHKYHSIIVVSALYIFCFYTQASFAEPSCELKMGWEPWEPYQFLNKDKQLTGLDIELIGAVVKEMGCKIQFKQKPWKRLLVEAKNGSMDIVAGASKTEERQKWAYFTDIYREETRVLFTLNGTSKQYPFKLLKDFIGTGFIIGVNRGAFNGDEFDQLMQKKDFKKMIQVVSKESQNHDKLIAKRIDGYIGDAISGINLLHKKNIYNKIEIHPVKINSSGIYVMFSKKSTTLDLVKRFNDSLNRLKKNGVYDIILKTYL